MTRTVTHTLNCMHSFVSQENDSNSNAQTHTHTLHTLEHRTLEHKQVLESNSAFFAYLSIIVLILVRHDVITTPVILMIFLYVVELYNYITFSCFFYQNLKLYLSIYITQENALKQQRSNAHLIILEYQHSNTGTISWSIPDRHQNLGIFSFFICASQSASKYPFSCHFSVKTCLEMNSSTLILFNLGVYNVALQRRNLLCVS
jgi:hypothetical protein